MAEDIAHSNNCSSEITAQPNVHIVGESIVQSDERSAKGIAKWKNHIVKSIAWPSEGVVERVGQARSNKGAIGSIVRLNGCMVKEDA